jgi:multiple sugar transport system ATP-binding protein
MRAVQNSPAGIRFEQVAKRFGAHPAVRDVDLEVEPGECLVLLGPSGCGKTTLLRLLAGLERPDAGRIHIGDRDVTDLAPGDRDVAMVFQNYALYPHLTVEENIGFPLRTRRIAPAARGERVAHAAERLGLRDLLARKPAQLSGGQQQRVALARAIVRNPAVYAMDEPLSNLDAQLRLRTRTELKKLQQQLGTTMIYVTHDQGEAMTLGSRVALMREGRIEQLGAPLDLYERPVNTFAATFVGSPAMNLLAGRLITETACEVAGGTIAVRRASTGSGHGTSAGQQEVLVGFRAESVTPHASEVSGAIHARIAVVEPLGHETLVTAESGGAPIVYRGTVDGTRPGIEVWLTINPGRVLLFDPTTGLRT